MARNSNLAGLPKIQYAWKDRKRFMGMPLSFTRYMLSNDRLFLRVGFLSTKSDEILLYRVRDLGVSQTLWQRIFGVGSVNITSTDSSLPNLTMKNVKHPYEVKELIHQFVEEAKLTYKVRISEFVGGVDNSDDCGCDCCND